MLHVCDLLQGIRERIRRERGTGLSRARELGRFVPSLGCPSKLTSSSDFVQKSALLSCQRKVPSLESRVHLPHLGPLARLVFPRFPRTLPSTLRRILCPLLPSRPDLYSQLANDRPRTSGVSLSALVVRSVLPRKRPYLDREGGGTTENAWCVADARGRWIANAEAEKLGSSGVKLVE